MSILLTYPAQFGQPSASPFCVKAMYALNASGVAWTRADTNDPRKMPHRKLPVLRTTDRLISGSDAIAAFASETGVDIDAGLPARDRAIAHALTRMVEEHLYFLLVLDRWERDEVWPSTRDAYFHEIPAILRGLISGGIRKTSLKGLQAQGLGRLTWSERIARARADFDALAGALGNNAFLLGDVPRSVDTSVAPILAAIRSTPVRTDLQDCLAEFPDLTAYCDRVDHAFGNGAPPATSAAG